MILKVKERCGEWVENQWVVLLPAGERNDWSSPLLAVNKVSGGVVALGDICLCMDFRRVNMFIIPLLKKMLGRLVGLKIFSELDLMNAYHQVNLDEDSYLLTGFIIPGSGAACWRVLFFGPKGVVIKLRLLVTETSRNRKKKENRGKIDSHQARLLQRKESRWNIYYDVSIKNPHPNSLISINCVFSHK